MNTTVQANPVFTLGMDSEVNQAAEAKLVAEVNQNNQATEVIYEDSSDYDFWGIQTYATRAEALAASMAAHPAGKHRVMNNLVEKAEVIAIRSGVELRDRIKTLIKDERGDVPGWVLVVLMTTGLVTTIWAIAKPNLTNILNNSLNSMNNVR